MYWEKKYMVDLLWINYVKIINCFCYKNYLLINVLIIYKEMMNYLLLGIIEDYIIKVKIRIYLEK